MNQNNSDGNENNDKGSQLLKGTIHLFVTGLGAFSAIVLTSMLLLIIWLTPQIGIIKFIYFFIPLAIALWIYSTLTTEIPSGKVSYRLRHIVKRFFDVILSSLQLFLASPLMILLALAIKLDSPGPIFYRSKRVGQYGRLFDIYLFRTKCGAPAESPTTRIGNFLLRLSLDRLPMLYNVLEGELSIVGPYPRQPNNLENTLDTKKRILLFRPGMTGAWQISNIQKSDLQGGIALDLEYIEKWTLLLDFQILFKTVIVVLLNRNK